MPQLLHTRVCIPLAITLILPSNLQIIKINRQITNMLAIFIYHLGEKQIKTSSCIELRNGASIAYFE